jgi:hypothetical protein
MTNWYYVQGSERVGPVSEQFLQRLFLDNEINAETYVWKKGFQNWERIKNVSELNFDQLNQDNVILESEPINFTFDHNNDDVNQNADVDIELNEEEDVDILFQFNWNDLDDADEVFYIKIGKDRKNFEGTDVYGPYSFNELKDALESKRINKHTLIFTPGMEAWQRIHDTPLSEDFKLGISSGIILNEMPLMFVHIDQSNPLISLVKKASTKDLVLLANHEFKKYVNHKIKFRLFVGSNDKSHSVEVEVLSYDTLEQTLDCRVTSISDDAKKILLNHAG